MPLQNRVDPLGNIAAVASRGLFTGNRGIIHDPRTRSLLTRRWSNKAWIICECEFRGRRRQVMGPGNNGNGSWTELFFLDEVTAMAAGHRPCFYCRRSNAVTFAEYVANSLGVGRIRAPELDRRLHRERIASGGKIEPMNPENLRALPDGTMIAADSNVLAIKNGECLPWSFDGYGKPLPFSSITGQVSIITPKTIRRALDGGYLPVWHPSAEA